MAKRKPGPPPGTPAHNYNPSALRREGKRPPPISPEAARLLEAIAQRLGTSKAKAIELGLMAIATKEELQ